MRSNVFMLAALAAMFVFVVAASPQGQGNGQGTQIKDGFIAYGEAFFEGSNAHEPASNNGEVTLGDAISGVFFGNTANPRPDGNGVLPSQSPGPFSNDTGEMYACHLGDVISNSVRSTGDDCDAAS